VSIWKRKPSSRCAKGSCKEEDIDEDTQYVCVCACTYKDTQYVCVCACAYKDTQYVCVCACTYKDTQYVCVGACTYKERQEDRDTDRQTDSQSVMRPTIRTMYIPDRHTSDRPKDPCTHLTVEIVCMYICVCIYTYMYVCICAVHTWRLKSFL
jgi:hypothetical protein